MYGIKFFSRCGQTFCVVEIKSKIFAGFWVFNNPASAIQQLQELQESVKKHTGSYLKYDESFEFTQTLIDAYMEGDGVFTQLDTRQVYLTGF